jgi:zinc protease
MAARLLRKGTPSLSAVEFSEALDRLGARFSSSAEADAIQVSVVAPAPSFPEALGLLLDAVTEPAFGRDELESARTEQLGEIASLGEEPFRFTNRRFDGEIFANAPYARSIMGDSASVEALTVGDVRDYIASNFVAERAAMSVVGPVDPDAVAATVQRAFEGRRGDRFTYPDISEEATETARQIWVEKDQAQVTYNTGWPAVGVRHPDYYPLKIATSILGRRFFYEFVYEKSMAYRSWFYMRDRMGPSAIQNEMGVKPDDFDYASGGILEGVSEFVDGTPDEIAVESAKSRLASRFAIRQQDPLGLARLLAVGGQRGLGASYLKAYPEAVRAVPADAVYEAARRYLHPDKYLRVAVGKQAAPVN